MHDCRPENVIDHTDKHLWEAFLFTEGITSTYKSVNKMYEKPLEEDVLKRE